MITSIYHKATTGSFQRNEGCLELSSLALTTSVIISAILTIALIHYAAIGQTMHARNIAISLGALEGVTALTSFLRNYFKKDDYFGLDNVEIGLPPREELSPPQSPRALHLGPIPDYSPFSRDGSL